MRPVRRFELSRPVTCKPRSEWQTIAVELLGTQTRFVQGERWRHRVIEAGDGGEPLILLHGIGGHAETYARNMRNLAANGFHVYAVDALYHGYTDKQPYDDDDRYQLQVEALVDLIDALGHEWAHVEGESMGASIACHFGFMYPERTGKLILNTGFGHVKLEKSDFAPPPRSLDELKQLSIQTIVEPDHATMKRRMEWLVAEPDRMTDEMVQLRLRLYADPDVNAAMRNVYRIGRDWQWKDFYAEADLANFKPETLVFWTDGNPWEGPDFGEYIASRIPNGSFYLMEDSGHWPQWEKPEEHDQVLIEFLRA
jgi:2-hydroxy-6-oxonona-2,4-dienedioate hydrolase/2-hydroxy-6-oxo-6-(2'-carboxyphenyl)-hexa-2,4-dienoate hydrolase